MLTGGFARVYCNEPNRVKKTFVPLSVERHLDNACFMLIAK